MTNSKFERKVDREWVRMHKTYTRVGKTWFASEVTTKELVEVVTTKTCPMVMEVNGVRTTVTVEVTVTESVVAEMTQKQRIYGTID